MTDSKQKCQGCGAETMSDVGWCLACRSILYTPLQIAESDFRRSEFKTMVFPVRDVIWLQERLRLRDAEIKATDTVNDEMGVTILSLRDDLAEARADCARFEAALDAANKELADKIDTNGILVRSVIERAGERDEYRHLYTVSELDRIKVEEELAQARSRYYAVVQILTNGQIDRHLTEQRIPKHEWAATWDAIKQAKQAGE